MLLIFKHLSIRKRLNVSLRLLNIPLLTFSNGINFHTFALFIPLLTMLGRYFLAILSVISLGWIVFIAYDLLDKKDQISPMHIFTENDGEILIINRSEEVNSDDLDFKINAELNTIFVALMKNVFPNERLYISENRPIIIIELPRIWNEGLVRKYFKTKQLLYSFDGKSVSNQFEVRFKRNHLLLTIKGSKQQAHDEESWPLWDGKASASIIHLKKPLKSTNIYFKKDGTVSYQTKYGPLWNCRKVNDYDFFAQFLPAKLENYHFYEKEYALKSKALEKKSPLYQWMEDGMVSFDYDNSHCLLSDYNKAIDIFFRLNL